MLGTLFEAFAADEFKIDIDLRIERTWPHRLLGAHEQERLDGGRGEKRRAAGQQFIENRTKRINIARRRRILDALRLLRRHVAGRANDGPGAGDALASLDTFREAEV